MPFMPFKTRPSLYYVYDMNRNSIYKITQLQYEALSRIESRNGIGTDFAVLDEFQQKGMLLDSPLKKVQHPATELLEYQLGSCVNSVTFQLSQNCNLRCNYCPYSDNGIYDNRLHTPKNMKWETLQKGIDFLIAHSKDVEHLHLAFYGGEPLIAKDLITDAIKYTLERVNGKGISFGMTTNGTMLDNDFARTIQDYDISIMVSFDGPKEIHDKNRTYFNGRGSYEVVYENIKHIKENYPKLYKKMKLNTVIAPGSDYRKIFDFFRKNQDISDLSKVNFNTLSQNYTEKTFEYGEAYFEERNYELLKAYLILLGKLKEEPIPFHKSDIEIIFSYKEFFTPMKETPVVAHPSGTCVPGLKKLFIDIHGNFYPCERVDENSILMKIGNVENGFNVNKVSYVLNIGAATERVCKDCWAFHCCSVCPISADNGKDRHYSGSYKLSKCKRVKALALENLKSYTMLREFKYQFNKEEILS